MGRTILGAVVGLVLAVITIMLVELAGHMAFPPPPGLNPQVSADTAKILATQPLAALLVVVAAWTMGAFDGGFAAALIARKGHPRAAAAVPALMVMTGVVAMIVAMPNHPKWMATCGLLLPIPAALLGAALATRLKPAGR
jgi:hypothetical protein